MCVTKLKRRGNTKYLQMGNQSNIWHWSGNSQGRDDSILLQIALDGDGPQCAEDRRISVGIATTAGWSRLKPSGFFLLQIAYKGCSMRTEADRRSLRSSEGG